MTSIANNIRELAGVNLVSHVYLCDAEVKSVDTETRTCDVALIGGKVSNVITVRLMASVDDGSLYIPTIGSTVVVTYSDFVKPYISQYSQIDSIVWLGGEHDGVPIVIHPTDHNKGLLAKINRLENLLNDLITKFNTHTHVLTLSAGTGTAATTLTQQTTNITPITQQADIEHQNIKH